MTALIVSPRTLHQPLQDLQRLKRHSIDRIELEIQSLQAQLAQPHSRDTARLLQQQIEEAQSDLKSACLNLAAIDRVLSLLE